MVKIKTALAFARAYVLNSIAEWSQRRLENKRRRWTAYKSGGGGMVPLGKVNQTEAIKLVGRFGAIIYVDLEHAAIFYQEKN